jgi:hypothetical protein
LVDEAPQIRQPCCAELHRALFAGKGDEQR